MKLKSIVKLLLLMAIPVFVGLYARFDDLKVWNSHREVFYYKDRPLFTSYDAFIFARFGQDYLEGLYKPGKPDPLKFVPDNFIAENVTYPDPIPMESWLGANLSRLEKTHIENVALWLTPVLSVLFAVPLVLFFYRLNLPITGFAGSLLGVISLIYLIRTTVVRFDTDSLNLFFPFAIAYFLLESTFSSGKRKYLCLVAAGLLAQLYNWWYSHPGLILVMVVTYVVWLIFFSKEDRKEKIRELLLLILFSNPVVLYSGVQNLMGSITTYLVNYFKPAVKGFPNVVMSISEARHFEFLKLARISAGNAVVFSLGFAGAVLLFMRNLRNTLFLLPIFLIGIIAFKGGNRFAMYIAPFVGMGLGYLYEKSAETVKARFSSYLSRILTPAGVVLLTAVLVWSNAESFQFLARPKITPHLEADFLKLQTLTPEDSWIWTWWDYGYAIQYLGRRATFHDGGSQGSPKTYFVATTYSTSSPQVAYNVITAIANTGNTGIQKLLKSGKTPEEIRDLIFSGELSAPLRHSVYWLFSEDEIGKFMWINYFGTWNFKKKKGLRNFIVPLNCTVRNGDVLVCNRNRFVIDIKRGLLYERDVKVPLGKLVIKDNQKYSVKTFHENGGLYLEYVRKNGRSWLFLMGNQPFNSMFNQMYILRNYDRKFFDLVYDDFPTMVLYRVRNASQEKAFEGNPQR